MSELDLLVDLHLHNARQGPGSDSDTLRALALSGIEPGTPLKVLDVGCGTGASTLCLAEALPLAQFTAVDFLPSFLEVLARDAANAGVADRISMRQEDMGALPFAAGEFDLIWSEGAVYNIGFETGVRDWKPFLKPGGIMVLSEITWLTDSRPEDLEAHWNAEYPEIGTASEKIAVLERNGYSLLGYFPLPVSSWTETYYGPLEDGFPAFLERQGASAEAKAIVEAERHEIRLFERYRDDVSYGVYVAKRL